MTKPRKIFISHSGKDRAALMLLKKHLTSLGHQCFLAHDDIHSGEDNYHKKLESEINDCDAMVYVCNKDSKKSAMCQQEIGMAIGRGKKIIAIRTDEALPEGFIVNVHASHYKFIDDGFCEEICRALTKEFPPSEEIQKHLDILGIKGFSRLSNEDVVYLGDNDWDDYGYKTTLKLHLNNQYIGEAKIGYIGQLPDTKTRESLPVFFTHLQLPFFAYVPIEGNKMIGFEQEQAESLQYLLNETTFMPDTNKKKISNEGVYQRSLMRYKA